MKKLFCFTIIFTFSMLLWSCSKQEGLRPVLKAQKSAVVNSLTNKAHVDTLILSKRNVTEVQGDPSNPKPPHYNNSIVQTSD